MHKLSKDTFIYAMSARNEPALRVEPGARIQFETWDALHGQVKAGGDGDNELDWNRVNPATGPVYINGAQPGDILSVKIERIDVAQTGVVMCTTGLKTVAIENGAAHFSESVQLPLNKMIGVIGVAPKDGEISNGVPDLHGGNMDCKEIREGAMVLLPVNAPGALLAIGDLHAVMADGEVCMTGVEVAGNVTVTVDIIRGKDLPLPMVINDTHVITVASDADLDIAVDMAVANMQSYLTKTEGFTVEDAIMLTSLVADVRICQIVDPKKTARVEFPKKYLQK